MFVTKYVSLFVRWGTFSLNTVIHTCACLLVGECLGMMRICVYCMCVCLCVLCVCVFVCVCACVCVDVYIHVCVLSMIWLSGVCIEMCYHERLITLTSSPLLTVFPPSSWRSVYCPTWTPTLLRKSSSGRGQHSLQLCLSIMIQ